MMKYPNPNSYDKVIIPKLDKTHGYLYFIDKEHPLSSKRGKVCHHRHVVSVKIGKWIDKSYQVHHVDGNRSNNDPSNLEVVSQKYHLYKHHKDKKYNVKSVKACMCCRKKFISIESRRFCSLSCANSFRQKNLKNVITEKELRKLVWSKPTVKVAEELNCSDVAVAKLCKKYGINKPPRGYWAKVKAGKQS